MVANNRAKINMRETFTEKEKKIILAKSDGRCCHCGESLTADTVTVEHAIPLSKGGLNRMSNLVGLCRRCNREKSNSIIEPDSYYRYLNENYRRVLKKDFDEYVSRDNWFDLHTFFPQDEYVIPNYSAVMPLYKGESIRKFFDEYHDLALRYGRYIMKHARYRDYEAIIDYYRRNSKRSEFDEEEIRNDVMFSLKNGSIFEILNNGTIIGVYMFYISCIYIYGKVTFSIVADSSFYTKELNSNLMNDYIDNLLIKGLLEQNGFSKMIVTKVYRKGNKNIRFGYRRNCLAVFGKESDNFDSKHYELWEYRNGKARAIPFDDIPEELDKESFYYKKIFSMSKLRDGDIEKKLEDISEIIDEDKKEKKLTVITLGNILRGDASR